MRNEASKKVISTKSLRNTSRGRSNLSQMFFKIGVLNNFAIFSGLDSLFNKVSCLEACDFIKKRLQHSYFPMNMAEFLRTAFFKEHFWWLLLKRSYWAPPQVFSIFMNVHEFFKFFTLGSISQCGNTWAMHLHYKWPNWQWKKQCSTTFENWLNRNLF